MTPMTDCGCGLADKCPDPPIDAEKRMSEDYAGKRIGPAPDASLLAALKAMKRAFGDPMTRRALGGHSEQQQEAILLASAAIRQVDDAGLRVAVLGGNAEDRSLLSLAIADMLRVRGVHVVNEPQMGTESIDIDGFVVTIGAVQ